jgi:magnesium-transporting ATPase (P-type)
VQISLKDVVPGDVVVLKAGPTYCDMVILQADHIVVDESALTGEATPIVKTGIDPSLPSASFSQVTHKSNMIAAGSEILEVGESGSDVGLVLTTGSFTTKGRLLTEVLSYKRHKFKFDDEVTIVVLILVVEAVVLLSLVLYFLKEQWVYAWFYGKDAYPLGRAIRVCQVIMLKLRTNIDQVCMLLEQSFLPCFQRSLSFLWVSLPSVFNQNELRVHTLKVFLLPAK